VSPLKSSSANRSLNLTKHNIVGDLFHATLTSYFALNNVQDQIAARAADVINYRGPSYGHFKSALQTSYWFSIPRDVTFDGLLMDIDASKVIVQSKTSDRQEEEINFLKSVGARYSAMEHLVPEQMFSTEEAPAYGISAVKAIALAAQEGQKIFTITQANLDTALSQISLEAEVEQEIRSAVYAGHIVTTHEALVDFYGSLAAGYIIEDPVAGAAAYKISGGGNGGELIFDCGVVCNVLKRLLGVVSGFASIVATIEHYLKALDSSMLSVFRNSAKFLNGVGLFVSLLEAVVDCSGFDIFIVLMPVLLLSVVIPLVLGPAGFVLSAALVTFISIILGVVGGVAMSELKEVKC